MNPCSVLSFTFLLEDCGFVVYCLCFFLYELLYVCGMFKKQKTSVLPSKHTVVGPITILLGTALISGRGLSLQTVGLRATQQLLQRLA